MRGGSGLSGRRGITALQGQLAHPPNYPSTHPSIHPPIHPSTHRRHSSCVWIHLRNDGTRGHPPSRPGWLEAIPPSSILHHPVAGRGGCEVGRRAPRLTVNVFLTRENTLGRFRSGALEDWPAFSDSWVFLPGVAHIEARPRSLAVQNEYSVV